MKFLGCETTHRRSYAIYWLLIYWLLTAIELVLFQRSALFALPWPFFAYLLAINALIAQRLVETTLTLTLLPHDLPQKEMVAAECNVALLYCTCDDVVEESLGRIDQQTYPHCEPFVLDDSRSTHYKAQVDDSGFRVVRRGGRNGFKAGNINHWLRHYGDNFEYFVILDSDSILPGDFVQRMLRYAEHPENRNVAIFESKVLPWKARLRIEKFLEINSRIFLYANERLSNRLGTTLSIGHNNLCRARDLMDVGGFDESFVSEDHATTLNLLKRKKYCKLVDVSSFEGVPDNLVAFARRAARWARSDLQLLAHSWSEVPLDLQLNLFLRGISHLLWIPYVAGMLSLSFFAFQNPGSWTDMFSLARYVALDGVLSRDLWPAYFMFSLFVFYVFLGNIPFAITLGIRARPYAYNTLYGISLGLATAMPVLFSLSKAILRRPLNFIPTPKSKSRTPLLDYSKIILPTAILAFCILVGVAYNPVLLFFNWVWMMPLLAAPFILFEPRRRALEPGHDPPRPHK